MFEATGWQGDAYQRSTGVHRFNIPTDLMDQMIDETARYKAMFPDADGTEPVEATESTLHFKTPPKEFSIQRARLELVRAEQKLANIECREAIAQKVKVEDDLERVKQYQKQLLDLKTPESVQHMAAREVDRLLAEESIWNGKVEAALQMHAKAEEAFRALQAEYAKEGAGVGAFEKSSKTAAVDEWEDESDQDSDDFEMLMFGSVA